MFGRAWERPTPRGTRKKIYDYIRSHPGTHVRRIGKELNLAVGDLQYHLHSLEKGGLIRMKISGFYKFVYPSDMFGEKQKTLLGLLSQEVPREILLFLVQKPKSTQKDLAKHLGLSQATVSWHMSRMIKEGVVESARAGKSVTYNVTVNSRDVIGFVQNYHPTIWENWASRLADIVLALSQKEAEDE